MEKIIYITGGARSGKSLYAEKYIANQVEKTKIYLATGIAFDNEMKERVKKHKAQRGSDWITIEEYENLDIHLEKVLNNLKKQNKKSQDIIILLDCLTNMVSNMMIMNVERDWDKLAQDEVKKIENNIKIQLENLFRFVKKNKLSLVVVSNEVGMGIVPENSLARYFRDIAGRMNQLVAQESKEAYLLVSGIDVKLK
ncbi:MAG: bifunctional adenosylcobinamide kinase/adenosylcobinamide-phosphate guanylyltransferase [Fusobacteriaceae bacterium]